MNRFVNDTTIYISQVKALSHIQFPTAPHAENENDASNGNVESAVPRRPFLSARKPPRPYDKSQIQSPKIRVVSEPKTVPVSGRTATRTTHRVDTPTAKLFPVGRNREGSGEKMTIEVNTKTTPATPVQTKRNSRSQTTPGSTERRPRLPAKHSSRTQTPTRSTNSKMLHTKVPSLASPGYLVDKTHKHHSHLDTHTNSHSHTPFPSAEHPFLFVSVYGTVGTDA